MVVVYILMSSVMVALSTENVVASTSIEQELDLETLSDDLESVRFDPENFSGLVY